MMKTGVVSGSLLSHINDILLEDYFYICVDHDINCLKCIKKYAERNFKFKNFLFIGAYFLNIPIKRVDIIFDYLGSINYNFRNEGFLMDLLRDKLKM